MDFQEFAKSVENNKDFPNSITVEPYVYKDGLYNTVVFEINKIAVTLFDDGTYILQNFNEKK